MPTYQYACTDCGDRSEVVQRFTDDPLKVCSACGGKLRKVFSAVGIVFKGSGFYRTDSRESAGSKSLTGANGSSDSSSNGDSGAKSDSGSSTEKKADSSGSSGGSATAASSSSSSSSSGSSSSGSSSSGSKVA